MEDWTQTLGTAPLLTIAAAAIALILVLVIKFKLHAFLTLILVALLTAFATGIPTGMIVDTAVTAFGGTLGSVALLIGLGAMLGKLVEHSGGARVLADKLVDIFGEKRAPFGLGIASLIMGFPIFFDAGLVVMLPIIFAVARRVSGNNVLLYGIPAAGAFSVMHVFVPPHPGPVAATELYGADLGMVLLIGLLLAFPLWYVSAYLWGKRVGTKYVLPVPGFFGDVDDDQPANPPRVGTIIALLLLPLVLIFMNTGLDFLRAAGIGDALASPLDGIGLPVIFAAYIIAVVLRLAQGSATVALVTAAGLMAPAVAAGNFNSVEVAAVVLATAAGSVFAGHVNDSGFWLVGRLMGMDVKTTLKTWTVQQALESVLGFAVVLVIFYIA